jgi:hypothetical protein
MSLMALGSLYMLYGSRFHSGSSSEHVKIASIVEQTKTVKRKRDFYQSWVDVSPGDGLTQNDEIYTHEQSTAKILFQNGPEISLFENSLLRIKKVNNESVLSLLKGNLTAKLSKESPRLDIFLKDKKYSFESANANLQIEQGNGTNKFLVTEGKASLNMNGVTQVIKQNQVLIQDKKSGKIEINELPFILKNPKQDAQIYFHQNLNMTFHWTYNGLSLPAQIIIARDSAFSEIIVDKTVLENQFSYSFLEEGQYYWKLISEKKINESPMRSFNLIAEKPLQINLDKEVVYITPKNKEKVTINWTQEKSSKYLLKMVLPNKRSKNIELGDHFYTQEINLPGTYLFSVKSLDKNRPKALWSAPHSLSANLAKDLSITSTSPALIEKIIYEQKPSTLSISWNGPDAGVQYFIKLTKNNVVENFKTMNSTLSFLLKEKGEYLWEVKGETQSGITSNILNGKILIKVPLNINQTPSEGAVIELEKPDQLVTFHWSPVPAIKEYQFELSDDSTFKNIIYEKALAANNLSSALGKTGKYYWRVKVKNGNSIEYSTPKSVEIKPAPPLATPANLPSLKIKVKYLEDKTTFHQFLWSDFFISSSFADEPMAFAEWDLPANVRAKEYIVEIFKDSELLKLETRINTTLPHIIWKNAKVGTFYWRVSYIDFWGRQTDFSKPSTLSMEFDQQVVDAMKLKEDQQLPIELDKPLHNENILNVDQDDYLFRWIALPHIQQYQILIAKDLEFTQPIMTTSTTQDEIIIRCKDLALTGKENQFYWKVTSPEGNSSKRRMFHANCSPKKIKPQDLTVARPIPIPLPKVVPPPKPVEAPVLISKEKTEPIVTPVKKRKMHFFKVGLAPYKLAFTNTSAQYKAKINGNVYESLMISYHRQTDWTYFSAFSSSLWPTRGKVFQNIIFNDIEGSFKLHRYQSSFTWGPLFALMKNTLYIESNLALVGTNQISPLAGLFLKKELGRFILQGEAKIGAIQNIHFDLQYLLRNRFSFGFFYDMSQIKKDASDHRFSKVGINLNYTYPMLRE